MQGFFSLKEIMEASATSAPTEPFCNDCGLFKFVKSPKMPFSGNGRKQVLIIAEVPGETEDRYNRQLVGVTGEWIERKLKAFGYDLYKDFWLINSVNCRTINQDGTNRNPTPQEVDYCRPYVESVIKQLNPKAILIFGEASCRSFFGPIFNNDIKIGEWENLAVPSRKFNCWLLPLYHPQYIIRNSKDENLNAYFDITLRTALERTQVPFPQFDDHTKKVKTLYKIDEICKNLTEVLESQPEYFFFDYEANGLKPQRPNYKIVTQSFSVNPNEAISFPFQYRHYFSISEQIQIKSLWRKIMLSKIKKVAHNLKFEYSLTKNIFGCDIENRYWCTMDAAHIEDGRFKYTGLKKQTYLKFGVEPYNTHIEPFLQEVGTTGINRIEELDLEDLLEYGGYDSLFGHRLLLEQKKTLTNDHEPGCGSLADAREFFMETAKCFMEISDRGFPSDIEYYKNEKVRLQRKIVELKQQIRESKEAQLFLQQMGREVKIGKQLSDDDMRVILFDILKIPPHKLTSSGTKPSVDSDSLERIDLPFVKTVVELKHNVKIDGNYINGFIRETMNDGRIHPSINLNIARSYRSSCSDPNLQNVPIREEMAKKSCRSGLFPSFGNQLLFADYKGIEVCVAAMYSGDKNLIKYITDPTTDMHKDKACELWKLPPDRVTKDIRFYAKNKWVFAQFYGDWYGACAEQLWFFCLHLKTVDGVKLEDHLINIGMFSRNDRPENQLKAFKDHCRTVEDHMWNEQFGDLKKWQIKTGEEYRKKSYVTLKHGFRRGGAQSMNQIGNTPIQGTAFHLLCKTITECNLIAKREQWRSGFALQIHDESITDLNPSEYEHVRKTLNYVGTQKIREDYEWINVPLTLEFEAAAVNAPWYYKTEIDEKGICTKKDSPWFKEQIIGREM